MADVKMPFKRDASVGVRVGVCERERVNEREREKQLKEFKI